MNIFCSFKSEFFCNSILPFFTGHQSWLCDSVLLYSTKTEISAEETEEISRVKTQQEKSQNSCL